MIFPVNKPKPNPYIPYQPQAAAKLQQLQTKNNYYIPSEYYPQTSQLPQRTLPTQNPSNSLKNIPTIYSPAKNSPSIFFQAIKPRTSNPYEQQSANKWQNVRSQSQERIRKQNLPAYSNSPIPPQKESQKQKKTLVLDLDETLIHSSMKEPYSYDLSFSLRNSQKYYVIYRPGVQQFLKEVAAYFEVIIWTASIKEYADSIIDQLDPKKLLVSYRLYRENCKILNNSYVKDLSMINRNLKDVIIVDNLATCFKLHQENGIQIVSFFDDSKDTELASLIPFLKFLNSIIDVRDVRRWGDYFKQTQYLAKVKNTIQNKFKNEQEEQINKDKNSNNNISTTTDKYILPQIESNQFYLNKPYDKLPLHIQMINELKLNEKEKQIKEEQDNIFKQNSSQLLKNIKRSNSQANDQRIIVSEIHRNHNNSNNLNFNIDMIKKDKEVQIQGLIKQDNESSLQERLRQDIQIIQQQQPLIQEKPTSQRQANEIQNKQNNFDDTFLFTTSYSTPRFLQLPNQSQLLSNNITRQQSKKDLSKTLDIQATEMLPTLLKSTVQDDSVKSHQEFKYLQEKGDNLDKTIDQIESNCTDDIMNLKKNKDYENKYQFYLSPPKSALIMNIYTELKDSPLKNTSSQNDKEKFINYNSAVSTSAGDSDKISRFSKSQINDSGKIQEVQPFTYGNKVSSFEDYPLTNPQITKYQTKNIF